MVYPKQNDFQGQLQTISSGFLHDSSQTPMAAAMRMKIGLPTGNLLDYLLDYLFGDRCLEDTIDHIPSLDGVLLL